MHFVEHRYAGDPTNWWVPNRACAEAMLRSAGLRDREPSRGRGLHLPARTRSSRTSQAASTRPDARYDRDRSRDDLERAEQQVALGLRARPGLADVRGDGDAGRRRRSRAEQPRLPRVLGGMSPIDPGFIRHLRGAGACWTRSTPSRCTASRSTGTTGRSTSGRDKLDEIRAVTDMPVWVSEVGVSTFGAEEVQDFGLRRTAELLTGRAPAHPLVQPLRPAAGLAGDHPAPRGRGLVLLPAFLHGPAARGRHAEAARWSTSPSTRPSWASASGSISRTTGSTTRSAG